MRRLFLACISTVLTATFLVQVFALPVSALSGSQFKAGRIIDDAIFFDSGTMGTTQIQNFFNAKVPVCDTSGTKPYGGTTRKAYAASNGVSTPFICLKDYKQNTPSRPAESGLCDTLLAKSNRTAAQIINDVAKACGINPKVLIVLLQKEQSLVTDDWPWPIQYRSATGYGCPDTAPCDSEYYGFFNQVYMAARQFRRYAINVNLFNYRTRQTNYIQYHPVTACGGSNVFIENQATAGLYNYTPYQPNDAALNNLYGTGNGCSAYGNRNFWRLFIEWFGSTYSTTSYNWMIETNELFSNAERTNLISNSPVIKPGDKIYGQVKARNMGTKLWEKSFTKIGTTNPSDRPSSFANDNWLSSGRLTRLSEASIGPGEVGTFLYSLTAPTKAGTYRESFRGVAEGRAWFSSGSFTHVIDVVEPITVSDDEIDAAILTQNTELKPGEFIFSPEKHSVLTLQEDGNLVYYSNFKAVWSTKTSGKPVSKAVMQGDGNFVLYSQSGSALWHSKTSGNNGARLVIQPDGNLVLYSSSDTPLWHIGNVLTPDNLSRVNKKLPSGFMLPGQKIETADRRFRLVLQSDGNLVLYSPNRAIWHTKTNGKSISRLSMQSDGNLVLYDKFNKPIWHTKTNGRGTANLTVQQDGNLVLYDSKGKPIWHTHTAGME